jgi:hypothetical protein
MPNRHFGEIGDVWKHLPLASILQIENPRYYWETHSGSAIYALNQVDKESLWKKDYGVVSYQITFMTLQTSYILEKIKTVLQFLLLVSMQRFWTSALMKMANLFILQVRFCVEFVIGDQCQHCSRRSKISCYNVDIDLQYHLAPNIVYCKFCGHSINNVHRFASYCIPFHAKWEFT